MQNLYTLFANLGLWNWLILAVCLFILETMVPGVHFLWFGMAAVVVGFLAWLTGMPWQLQIAAFGILSVAAVFLVRRYMGPDVAKTDVPDLNERGRQYIGRRAPSHRSTRRRSTRRFARSFSRAGSPSRHPITAGRGGR